ncbi:MAG: hypothetical protein Q9160_006228 [Pyrenula sp. 1 TL-2023]
MTEQLNIDSVEDPVSKERHNATSNVPTKERSSLIDQSQDAAPAEEKADFKPGRSFILAFFSICIITLAVALDATSLSIALPIITERLKGTALQAFWSGTSFLIASAVIQPVIGGFSHAFGRKQLVVVSSVFFAAGSLIAALATSFTLVYFTAWSLSLALLTPWLRPKLTFWLEVDILDQPTDDWIGGCDYNTLLEDRTAEGSNIGQGGVMFAWASWHTLVPLLLGTAGLLAFGFHERNLSAHVSDSEEELSFKSHMQPIIRFSIFGNWTLRLLYILTLVHGVVLWGLLYFLPLYYEGVKGYTPIITGVAVLPETFLTAPVAIIVGIVSSRIGGYRWAIWIGWGITTIGFGLLYLLDPGTSIVTFIFLNIPVAIGTGMAFASMSLGVQAAGRPQDAGHSITFYSFIRVFGQALGVAIGGVVFQNQIQQKLRAYPSLAASAEDYSRDATELVGVIKSMQNGMRKTQLVQAYADSLKMIWIVMAALSGAVFVSSFFLKGYSLDQEHKTLQGFNDGNQEGDSEKD